MITTRIDLEDLAQAFDDTSPEASHYLDLDTGAVIRVDDETRREMEELLEGLEDSENRDAFCTPLVRHDLPDWQREFVELAYDVEFDARGRFRAIPAAESHEGYRDMEDFADTVQDDKLGELLGVALNGRGAFRRFKDVLVAYPDERDRWFRFKNERLRKRALEWLASEKIGHQLSCKEIPSA